MKVIITLEIHDPHIIEAAKEDPRGAIKDRLQRAINNEWPYCRMSDLEVTNVMLEWEEYRHDRPNGEE